MANRGDVQLHAEASLMPLWLALLVYAGAAGVLWPVYRWQVNVDGISYISIARKYLGGEWPDAVNGYWSPLFSWLLVGPLAMKVSALTAAKVVNLLIGAGALALVHMALRRLRLSVGKRSMMLLAAAAMALQCSFTIITPDLLSAALVLGCVVILMGRSYWRGRGAALLGLTMAGAYLAKSYNLPFVVMIVVTVHIMMLRFRRRRRVVARQLVVSLAVAGAAAALWVMPISRKYGKLTIGTSGALNHALFGPAEPQWPPFTDGLIPPPNPTALSAWEDPSYFSLPQWSPLHGRAAFTHQLRLIRTNAKEVLWIVLGFSVLAAPAGLAGLWMMRRRRGWRIGALVLAAAIYPAGYMLVCVEERYLWPVALVLLVLAGGAARMLRRQWRPAAVAVVAASFVLRPVYLMWDARGELRDARATAGLADRWAELLPVGVRVATDSNPDPRGASHWHEGLTLSFHRDARFYGETRPGASAEEIADNLREHGIKRFIVYRSPAELPFLANWQRLSPAGESPALYARPAAE